MLLRSLFSVSATLTYFSTAFAAATDLELTSPSSFYEHNNIKRGWSTFDTRQDNPPPANPNDPNASRLVQIVRVGDNNGSLKFFPEKVTAQPGDVVQFHFYPKNHTITEGLFAKPCAPLPAENATAERPGQKSGFIPVTPDAQFRPIYNVVINDTKPMWIYCGQMPHCQKGMAMVINEAPGQTEKTLEKYKEAAAVLAVPNPSASSPPPAGTTPPPTNTNPGQVSTVTPSGQTVNGGNGPSLVSSPSASASVATFNGDASRDLAAWGSTWSVGMVALAGMGLWL